MKSLVGRKVMVTRTIDDCRPLVDRLRRAGAETVVFPCISVEYLSDHRTLDRLRTELSDADWLVFASRRGVRAIAAAAERVPDHVRIAAVGEATEAEAHDLLGRCDLVAEEGTGRSLGRTLRSRIDAEGIRRGTVVVAAAEHGRRDLEEELEGSGCRVRRIEVYRTSPIPAEGDSRFELGELGIDTVVLASPSATIGLLNQAVVAESIRIVTIGPTTSEAVRKAGLVVAAEATKPTTDALLRAV